MKNTIDTPASIAPPRPAVESYFGEGYYHLYKNFLLPPEQTEAEVQFLMRLLKPRHGAAVLDAPCGYGRHLKMLRKKRPDLRLTGADLKLGYLRERGLARKTALVQADMRRLPFAGASFDLTLSMLNSFGYYPPGDAPRPDDRDVLAELARVLRPGGRAVFDLPNRRALIDTIRHQPIMHYFGGGWEAEELFSWDRAGQCMENTTTWTWDGGRERRGYRVRLYTPAQFRRMLARAGLEWLEVFGAFNPAPFDPWDSDRMLVIAGKPPLR